MHNYFFFLACPNGTYASGEISGDFTSMCVSCPDVNHVTIKVPATSVEHCVCASGFTTDGNKCEGNYKIKFKIIKKFIISFINSIFYQKYPIPAPRVGIFLVNGVTSLRGSGYCDI